MIVPVVGLAAVRGCIAARPAAGAIKTDNGRTNGIRRGVGRGLCGGDVIHIACACYALQHFLSLPGFQPTNFWDEDRGVVGLGLVQVQDEFRFGVFLAAEQRNRGLGQRRACTLGQLFDALINDCASLSAGF